MKNRTVFCSWISALLLIAAILVVGATSAVNDTECASLAASGNCSFYDICIEAVTPCGSSGYAEGYGEKYCKRFGDPEYQDRFNDKVSVAVNVLRSRYVYIYQLLVECIYKDNLLLANTARMRCDLFTF